MFGFGKSKSTAEKTSAKQAKLTSKEQLENLFSAYTEEDDADIMTMDGIAKFFEDLGVDPGSDVRSLVIMWKLGAISKPGCITKEEFCKGMKTLGKKTITELKSDLSSFDPGFLETKEFRGMYPM